jgi:hypothetical protein
MQLMADTLSSEIRSQPIADESTARDARESVLKAAEDAFEEVPEGKDVAERHVPDQVKVWVRLAMPKDHSQPTDGVPV